MQNGKFDNIRPYYNNEISAAMERISQSEYFPLLSSYIYPNKNVEDVRKLVKSFNNIKDFQLEVMRCVNEQVINRSVTNFSYNGINNLSPDKKYLFISNHRDIMLDSCLLQYVLTEHGHDTTEITFGANLMMNQLIIDIGKSNKMFRVERGGNMKEFYKSSLQLSEYIRYVITEKKESVWIAQRNGRTKDGIDATDQGIIKMFTMSKPNNNIEALDELNIVPVAISYELEPCDILKTLEIYNSKEAKYIKKEGEDLNSIITGIVQQKGRLHIEFCKPITRDELQIIEKVSKKEFHKNIARLIDNRILSGYRLMPTNFIAYDLLEGEKKYSKEYTSLDFSNFVTRMEKLLECKEYNYSDLKNIYLGIYSNPVKQKFKVKKEIVEI